MHGKTASTDTQTSGATNHRGQPTRARASVTSHAERPHKRPCHIANSSVTGIAAGSEKPANFVSSSLSQKKPQNTVMMPTSQP